MVNGMESHSAGLICFTFLLCILKRLLKLSSPDNENWLYLLNPQMV